jgi:hypothetical protein
VKNLFQPEEHYCGPGLFLFGGLNKQEQPCDDLYHITVNMQEAECFMCATPVLTSGQGPCPRYKHSAEVFKNYLVIFGGRNDVTEISVLNDLHLLNLQTNNWMTLALFGQELPRSRFGHSLAATTDKLLLFGGMNLKSYCESEVFEVLLSSTEVHSYL